MDGIQSADIAFFSMDVPVDLSRVLFVCTGEWWIDRVPANVC